MAQDDMKLLVDSCVFIDWFDPQSANHAASAALLTELKARNLPITMPAHGWFEIWCTFKKLEQDRRFVGPILAGKMEYPINLLYIDEQFIKKYTKPDIPQIKAGDHIFVVVAKVNDYTLITSDVQMIKVSKECGIKVFTPAEFMDELPEA